jgi:hypothetical protein
VTFTSVPAPTLPTSVADPRCLSRIQIFYPSRIQKPQQKRGVKKFCCHIFFCSHKFHKIEKCFIFEMQKKKIWPSFPKSLSLSSKKHGIGIRYPGSGINPFPDPGSESRGQKGTGSRNRIRNTVTYHANIDFSVPDSVADPKLLFRIRFRIRIRPLVSFGFGSGFGSGFESGFGSGSGFESWIRIRIQILDLNSDQKQAKTSFS